VGDSTQLRRTFDSAAERYDRARRPYPAQIFEDFSSLAGLAAGSRVLEIGCGTGHATVPLAERRYQVVAVELGAELARVARRNLATHPNAEVVVADFETWPLPKEPFDAVVSATAFHWIDPDVRVAKAADALVPGGSLAIIETRRKPLGPDDVLATLHRCHERWGSAKEPPHEHDPGEPAESEAEIVRSGLFEQVVSRRYEGTQEYTTREFGDLLLTFSNVLALGQAEQAGLLECLGDLVDRRLGGRIGEAIVNHLVVVRKR
jgi:SAM-dependent methyltransferase